MAASESDERTVINGRRRYRRWRDIDISTITRRLTACGLEQSVVLQPTTEATSQIAVNDGLPFRGTRRDAVATARATTYFIAYCIPSPVLTARRYAIAQYMVRCLRVCLSQADVHEQLNRSSCRFWHRGSSVGLSCYL